MTAFEKLRAAGLSKREAATVLEIMNGGSNQETADSLFRSRYAVKFQITAVNHKWGTKSKAQIICKAAEILKGQGWEVTANG